jgi:hypothetical protein
MQTLSALTTTLGAVVLDRGRNHKVRANYPFTVYRDSQFVAKVTVIEVHDDYCLARVTEPGMQRLPMEIGDNATTRLQ